jgi:hypothetical protein
MTLGPLTDEQLDELGEVEPPDVRARGRRLLDSYYRTHMLDITRILGRAPTRREFEALSRHQAQTLANRFGDYTTAKRQAEMDLRREKADD